MGGKGISVDKVELLSTILEALLYGFSLLMFSGTMWALLSKRCTRYYVNRKIIGTACLLLLVSTTHLVINVVRTMEAFSSGYPGGAAAYFDDVSQWTFVSRQYVFTAQTLLGDAVVLYRCYVAWQSELIMVLPMLLWCAVAVTGVGVSYTAGRAQQEGIFQQRLMAWLASFWASALVTNLLTTILLSCRIWYVDQRAKRTRGTGKSQLQPMLHIIIDAGVIYSVVLLAALLSFVFQANFPYGMVTPIVSITFYMVIIRVGLSNRTKQSTRIIPLSTSSDDPEGRLRIHITTLTESKVEYHPSSSTPVPVGRGDSIGEDKAGNVIEVV